MEIEYTYEAKRNIVNVYPPEVVSFDSIHNYVNAVLQDDKIKSGFSELIHFENVKTFNISASAVAEACNELKEFKRKKLYIEAIILAKTDLQFGMARMFHSYLSGQMEVKIF